MASAYTHPATATSQPAGNAIHAQHENGRSEGIRPVQGFRSLQAVLSGYGVRPRLVVGRSGILSPWELEFSPAERLPAGAPRRFHDAFARRGRRSLVEPHPGYGPGSQV